MSEKKRFAVSSPLTHRLLFGFIFLTVVLGFWCFFGSSKDEMVLKTAVITEPTALYMDPQLSKEYSGHLSAGDLINVVYRHGKDVFYVLDSSAQQPFMEGYLSGDKFTYDFDKANQAILGTNTVFTEKDNQKPAGYVVEKGRTRCIIHSFEEDDWVSISLPGGIDGLWVKKDRLIYDLNYDILEEENYGHYNLVKKYMEEEYLSAYDKYYDHNYVRSLLDYDERYDPETGEFDCQFVLNGMSKNKYKDPDKVGYIKDAKEAATDESGQLYYEKLYREYNMYRNSNFVLMMTATVKGKELTEVKLYSDMGVGASSEWKELKNGLRDFIIEE